MGIELKDFESFRRAIGAVSAFVSEGNVRFNNQGVFIRETDPSQVVLVDFFLPKHLFDKFVVEPSFVGVDLAELTRVLSRGQQKDHLKLELSDSELTVWLQNDFAREFRLSLLDISREEPTVPNVRFDAVVQVNARLFKEALKDAALFGNSLVIKVKGSVLRIESRGNAGVLESVASEARVVSVKSTADCVGKFNLLFLQNLIKEAENESRITLELKSDSPMKISYQIGAISAQFYLAHMIL